MRIRVEGTKAEVHAVVTRLAPVLDVQEISRFYDNHGPSQLGRVYLTVATPAGPPPNPVPAERVDRDWAQLQRSEHRADRDAEQTWGPA